MMRLDVATLSIHTGKAAAAQSKIEHYFKAGQGAGTLCASWTAELGDLNRVLVLRAFDDSAALHAERERMLVSGDVFGASEHLIDVTFEAYAPFPYFPPRLSGTFGGVYEFRVYRIKPTGIKPVLAAWETALPPRTRLSPIVFVGYALDGVTPRMLHICPYRDLAERTRIRAEAVASGEWPPKGGPDWLTVMDSTICIPAAFSPLR
ncbi:MAG: NIPSNAP family protein [Casimicrobiaceae bacterium]